MTTSKQQNEEQVPPERELPPPVRSWLSKRGDAIVLSGVSQSVARTADFERVEYIRADLATAGAVRCRNCDHANPHDRPAGAVNDACAHPMCSCGYFEPTTAGAVSIPEAISVVEAILNEAEATANDANARRSVSVKYYDGRVVALKEVLERLRSLSPSVGVGTEDAACPWTLDDSNDGDFWETGCGAAFRFTDEGPAENGFKFCYKCGKPINAGRYSDSATAHDETVSEGDAHE